MADIKAAVERLREAHKHTSGLKWKKGLTTHHTVTETGYRVAEFHHADDAHFCDVAHELVPLLCAELERARGVTPCADCRTADLCAEGGCAIKDSPPEGITR